MNPLLITPEELAARLDDPNWVVFDTRHDLADTEKGRRAYTLSHIPGAYFLHVDDDLSGEKNGANGRHPLPATVAFAEKMNARGVGRGVQVVAYDDTGGMYASRLWWLLDWFGHGKVALLDGGYSRWQREGFAITSEAPAPRAGKFVPQPRLGACVDAPFVSAFGRDAKVALIDARAAERYEGRVEPLDPVAGHIPGAVNRFWQLNLAPDGNFKSAEALREEYAKLLAGRASTDAIHTCGSGVTACHNLFAMELAGLGGSRLYPGSWSEWCADPARGVATGPAA
jgi:thiosulfate/3-mercaptopyruvate sulfurtransferase